MMHSPDHWRGWPPAADGIDATFEVQDVGTAP
jgi:hypothetical protein